MGEPEVYGDIINEFAAEREIDDVPTPELRVEPDRQEITADPDTYAIVIGGRHATRLGQEEQREAVKGALKDLYEDVLADRVAAHARELEELYAPFDAAVAVEEQVFADLNEDEDDDTGDRYTNGKYNSEWKTVKIDDAKFMEEIDPEDRTVHSDKLERVIRHECAHGLHYGTNPHVATLSDHVSATSDDYTGDVRRASIEAITRFEQYRAGYGHSDRDTNYRDLHDPWRVPDVFDDHTAYDEHGLDLFDSPYKLGHFAAHAIDAAFAEVHGDDARERTREFLLRCVTTPTALTGAIEESFYLRDLPYYPRLVMKWGNRLEKQDDPETYVERTATAAAERFDTADTSEERQQFFFELRALQVAAEGVLSDGEFDALYPDLPQPQ